MSRTTFAILLATATLGGGAIAHSAHAADQLVPGARLVITNKLPDQEKRNRIVVTGRSDSVSIQPPGSAGDPTCSGAGGGGGRLIVRSALTGETHVTDLPCENWTGRKTGSWRYNDREMDQGTCKRVEIRGQRTVRALCYGRGPTVLDFDLQPGVRQDPIDVVLEVGTAPERYCMRFGGKVGKDGSNGKMFTARKSPAPSACPDDLP
ncbi:MAG TPA: hypothetical protein VIS07_03405 [Candidatus Binatia bacterium]